MSEELSINKNDYKILNIFRSEKAYTVLTGITIKEIIEKSNLSMSKVRSTKRKFLKLGYIAKGAKDTNAETFYMTEKGKKELIDAVGISIVNN